MGLIGCLETSVTINVRCVTSQKSKYLKFCYTESGYLSCCGTGCVSFAVSNFEEDEIFLGRVMFIAFLSECFEEDRLTSVQLKSAYSSDRHVRLCWAASFALFSVGSI
jgi:hypothetical protein